MTTRIVYGMSTEIEIGRWYRVRSGPQKGATGVHDLTRDYPTGRVYRLVNPDTKHVVGVFLAEDIVPCNAPEYVSPHTPEQRQVGIDLLMGRRS